MTPLNLLQSDALHLAASGVRPVPGFGHDYERYLETYCTKADPGRLVAIHETKEAWTMWEVHPAGDEVVVVLRGRARFIQEIGGEQHIVVVGPNEAIINPLGTPHTADVLEPFTALYITACPGTHHRPRSARQG
jgi:hypothetical protein